MSGIKEIIIKMDSSFLIEKRLKKIESIKFDNNFPDYLKKVFIKDCEEYINILKAVTDYTTTAKNLAFIVVFHKIWSNKEFDNERLLSLFEDLTKDIIMTAEDLGNYNLYKTSYNFSDMALIINKYKNPESYVHTTISDRVIYGKQYTDVYNKAYNFINKFLDDVILNLEIDYNNYKTAFLETNPENVPLTLEEYKRSIVINVSKLFDTYYKENV